MKLELKQLAPYLPYELEIRANNIYDIEETFTLIGIIDDEVSVIDYCGSYRYDLSEIKPILLPTYHIPNEIIDQSIYSNHDELIEAIDNCTCGYNIFMLCVAGHYDVFGLIEKDLAINYLLIK